MVFLTSMINLQTITIQPPQPFNCSKAPITIFAFLVAEYCQLNAQGNSQCEILEF